MKKLIKKLLISLAVLTLLLLLPLTVSAQNTKTLEDYTDTTLLYDYIYDYYENDYPLIYLDEFRFPESLAYELRDFLIFSFPDCLLAEMPVVYGSDGYIVAIEMTNLKDTNTISAATDFLTGIEGDDRLTDLEKVLLIHDRLALWTEFDTEGYTNGTLTSTDYSEYGALVNRQCVSEGYAYAFRYLLARVGIRCDVHYSQELGRAWNAVHLNGTTYMVDVAKDDLGGTQFQDGHSPVSHDYFLKPDDCYLKVENYTNPKPYASTYKDTLWPDSSYNVNGQVYGMYNGELYRLNGTQMTRVTIGGKDHFNVSANALTVGNTLVSNYQGTILTIDMTTGREVTQKTLPSNTELFSYYRGQIAYRVDGTWKTSFPSYTVTFKDYDGTVLQTRTCQYSQRITPPSDPERTGYHFAGWDKPVITCSEDMEFTATYTPVRQTYVWYKNGNNWHYIVNDHYKTGWLKYNNKWYCLNYAGIMHTGLYRETSWFLGFIKYGDQYYFNDDGTMYTGWKKIDGSWYYFKPGDGSAAEYEWCKIDGQWYYFNGDGKLVTGWHLDISTGTYYLTEYGMVTGWKYIDGYWYYFDASGKVNENSWLKVDGKWYHFDIYNRMETGWVDEGGNRYYMTGSGAMATGWHKVGTYWYCFDSNGLRKTGWVKKDGAWRYCLPDAYGRCMAADMGYTIDGKTYYFDADGNYVTGWMKRGESWYYYDTSGVMVNGWKKISGTWYYFKNNGQMATGRQTIDGKIYQFNKSGALGIGWVKIPGVIRYADGTKGDAWCYTNSSGQLLFGWQKIDGSWYYFNSSSGYMNTGSVKIDNKWYTFGEDGKLIS